MFALCHRLAIVMLIVLIDSTQPQFRLRIELLMVQSGDFVLMGVDISDVNLL